MIKINNLTLAYIKEYNTLMNINCEFMGNSFILGNINDGTHSLFRILAKIDNTYTGDVLFDEIDIKNVHDKDMNLAYVPHEPYLFNRDIFYNLNYPLSLRRVDKHEAKKLINNTINTYLKNFPNKVKNMNNSEKKIITLLRAMIRKPKYVLIEDFFIDLDLQYHELAYDIIQEICKQSIVIACENKEVACYKDFIRYTLSYGSLSKTAS